MSKVKFIPLLVAILFATAAKAYLTPQISAGSGTVTSVGLSVPSFLTVTGSPVTSSGTLAISLTGSALANSSNLFTDASGNLSTTGTVAVGQGGTGTSNGSITGTGALTFATTGTGNGIIHNIATDTASSGNDVGWQLNTTTNQTSTAGYTDLYINRTNTASGSGNQYLFDAAVGGSNIFTISTGSHAVMGATDIGNMAAEFVAQGTTNASNYGFQAGQDSSHNITFGWLANSTASSATAFIETYSGNNNIGIQRTSTQGMLGVGVPAASLGSLASRLVVQGTGATSSTSALTVQNSTPSTILFARNDGNVGIDTGSPATRLQLSGTMSTGATGSAAGYLLGTASGTVTNTADSGTIATLAVNSLGTPTLVNSSATTYTNAATVYISAPPTASTNVTVTNPFALYIASGNIGVPAGAVLVNSHGSGTTIGIGGTLSTGIGSTLTGRYLDVASGTVTNTNDSGTVSNMSFNSFNTPTIADSNATTYTNAYNVYIGGAPVAGTNATINGAYSLYVAGPMKTNSSITTSGIFSASGSSNNINGYAGTSVFGIAGAIATTSVAGSTAGRVFDISAGTVTRSSDSGTIANLASVSVQQQTNATSSATTYTNTENLYVGAAPLAGTNVTQTNAWSAFFAGPIAVVGNMSLQGTAPTVSSCGSGTLTTGSSNHKGSITGVTTATACTITFSSALAAGPSCIFQGSAALSSPVVTSLSTSAVTFGFGTYTGTLYYICF